jgi:hypothetical protein
MHPLEPFYGQEKTRDGRKLTWPGTADGYPVVGDVPKDLDAANPANFQIGAVPGFATLRLPDDQKEYLDILSGIANGGWQLRYEEKIPLPDKEMMLVFICWLEPYAVPATPSARHSHEPIVAPRPL